MKKSEILKHYSMPSGESFKHQPLYIGDVFENNLGTLGIILFDATTKTYVFKRENGSVYALPKEKASMHDCTCVGNVAKNPELMSYFVERDLIEDDEETRTPESEEIPEPETPAGSGDNEDECKDFDELFPDDNEDTQMQDENANEEPNELPEDEQGKETPQEKLPLSKPQPKIKKDLQGRIIRMQKKMEEFEPTVELLLEEVKAKLHRDTDWTNVESLKEDLKELESILQIQKAIEGFSVVCSTQG